MKKSLILLGIMLMPVGMIGCSNIKSNAAEVVNNKSVNTRRNKVVKYQNLKLKLPSNWTKSEITDEMNVYKEEDKKRTFSIVKSESEVYLADEYFNKIEEYTKNVVKSSDVNSEKFKVDGADALKVKYNYSVNNGDKAAVYQVHIVKNGEVYILTMLTKEDNIDLEFNVMNHIIKSIRV